MRLLPILFALLAFSLAWGVPETARADADEGALVLIRNARIFDGTGAPAYHGDVLIRGEVIERVAPRIRRPRGAKVVDAGGKTLIPGLHDLHTHTRAAAYPAPEDMGKAWAGHLLNGVTTINDLSLSGEMIEPVRRITTQPGGIWAPHLNLAVRTGVQGGHGAIYGWGDFFTMTAETPQEARIIVDRAAAYHPNMLKVFADGWRYGRDPDLNSMNRQTLTALVKAAHDKGVPVVTHTVTLQGAKNAAQAGVDVQIHGIGDALVDDELIALMREHGTAYVPTLVVYEPQEARVLSPAEKAALSPAELAHDLANTPDQPQQPAPYDAKRWNFMRQNIVRLREAGIPIGIGTDAGIEGVYHGSSAIREMEWMERLGMSPPQVLVAATRTSAQIMGQGDTHGTIAPGMRADLVLIDGRPDENLADLRHVESVWLAGRAVPLAKLRARRDSSEMTPLPVYAMPGPIYTGTRADGRTDLDTLPVDATDEGRDHSHLDIVYAPQDAEGKRSIFTIAGLGASSRPFAGLAFPLTRGAVELADARSFTGVAFTVKGDGTYRLLLESYGLSEGADFRTEFEAGLEKREIRIPFSQFKSRSARAQLDLALLRAVRFDLLGEPDTNTWLEISDVRFY